MSGGISNASLHYSVRNNRYLEGGYDPEKGEKTFKLYFDATALYSFTISNFKLPHSNFEWVSDLELKELAQNFRCISADLIQVTLL